MSVHVGTSGWSYDHWEGVLYPHGLPKWDRLRWYVQRYMSVELNSSYYRWPRDRTFTSWRQRLPEGFVMTVKAPRGLTHGKLLYAPERWVERIAVGLHHLAEKRGVLLVQLPPSLAYDHARLSYFLGLLPGWLRVAVEFRHPSWHCEEIFELLEHHGVAYCVTSGANLPCILRATAPFVYARLHGPNPHHMYAGSYSDADLHWWAERTREWLGQGREVYLYFNNDGNGNAVRNAYTLRRLLQKT